MEKSKCRSRFDSRAAVTAEQKIMELLQYSSTLGVPDSIDASFHIGSDTCHPAPCYLNSNKLLSNQYRNSERGFKAGFFE